MQSELSFNLDNELRKSTVYQATFAEVIDNIDSSRTKDGDSMYPSAGKPEWLEPAELLCGLLPVPALSEKLIPQALRPWLTDIAERMQCPLEFPTIAAIVALSSVIGRRVGIKPKQKDDWLVIPNLWGAAIGRPGIMKSPALAEAMKPLHRLEAQARAEYEKKFKQFDFEKIVWKARKDDLERQIRAALKKGEDPASIRNRINEVEKEPILTRYIVNDSTVEKLGELLNQNPNGLLLFRDELIGWLRTLDREGHENDRAFYLEAWAGTGEYTYDRIGRGTLHIKAACVSILGGIQPGPLADYLRAAVKGGSDDDGLIQRLQVAVYPDDPGEWRNIDRWPDTSAKNQAFNIFHKLATQPVGSLGATLVPAVMGTSLAADDEIPFLRFSLDAQGHFDEWRTDLEMKLRAHEEHQAFESHLAKYRSLLLSLALIFHLIEITSSEPSSVSLRAAQMAAAWCDLLEAHARRIYQAVTQHALLAARQLAGRIKTGKLPTPFTAHNVYHNGWTGLSTAEDVERAAEILEELFWVRSERIPSGIRGGRPRFHYHINPHLSSGGKVA